jgi:hypothetical protein
MTSSVRIVANEEFLIKFHKPKDRVESEMFSKLLSNLAFEDPKTGEQMQKKGPEGVQSENGAKWQEKLRQSEESNKQLKEVVRTMMDTFNFFEMNDQYILSGRVNSY